MQNIDYYRASLSLLLTILFLKKRLFLFSFFLLFFFFSQVVLVTQYWTKYNVISIFASVGFYFLCTKITQSFGPFHRFPADYPFIGTDLLICCTVYSFISTKVILLNSAFKTSLPWKKTIDQTQRECFRTITCVSLWCAILTVNISGSFCVVFCLSFFIIRCFWKCLLPASGVAHGSASCLPRHITQHGCTRSHCRAQRPRQAQGGTCVHIRAQTISFF